MAEPSRPPDGEQQYLALSPPSRPNVLVEIEGLMRNPKLNLRTIARLISEDPDLSAIFLRTVNSPYYGLQHKIEIVEQVIPLIGLQQTLNIIRADALRRVTSGSDYLAIAHGRIHGRAQEISRLCTIIAEHYLPEYLSPNLAALVGQFHDSGIPIMMRQHPDYCASLNTSKNNAWPDLADEDRHIGIDHCEIGYRLTMDWKLPATVCKAIRHHHDFSKADEDTRGYIAVLQMAMHIYNSIGHSDDAEWSFSKAAVLDELEIAADDLDKFERSVMKTFREQAQES